jgi:hypothetical protein
MSLKDEIKLLIQQVQAVDKNSMQISHRRWLGMSNPDVPEPDYLPLVIYGFDCNRPEEMNFWWEKSLRYPLEEQFDNPEKMLYEQLTRLRPYRRFQNDTTVAVYPNYGNAFLTSAFGLDIKTINNCTYPEHTLTCKEMNNLELPEDLSKVPTIARAIRFIEYVRSVLPEHIKVGLFFMMSPFDLAFLLRGQELLIDMYLHPQQVHYLMQLCTDLFIRATKLLKQKAKEPDDSYSMHTWTLAGGGHICEDSCILLSPELHREFSIPYTQRALDALGGGWLHFCGNGSHLLENYFTLEKMHGIQFGQIELNGTVEHVIKKLSQKRRSLVFHSQKQEHESYQEYFYRILKPLKNRKYICGEIKVYTDKNNAASLLDIWHEVQDKVFSGK